VPVTNIAIVCDGTSDLCIQHLIQWIVDTNFPDQAFRINPAREVIPAHGPLHARLKKAFDNYEPDVIVCHRDAEKTTLQARTDEVRNAHLVSGVPVPVVAAVPVRMIESWLLTEEAAIRSAANNRNGNVNLNLPPRHTIESLPNPKDVLFQALKVASDLPPQRLKKFNEHSARSRVTSFIDDFSGLRTLPSFLQFENSLREAISPLDLV